MSDKQQTALQQLIEWNNSKDRYSMITWIELDAKLKEILPIEKQQIIDSYNNCIKDRYNNALIHMGFKEKSEKCYNTGLEYFNETFKTESNGTT